MCVCVYVYVVCVCVCGVICMRDYMGYVCVVCVSICGVCGVICMNVWYVVFDCVVYVWCDLYA